MAGEFHWRTSGHRSTGTDGDGVSEWNTSVRGRDPLPTQTKACRTDACGAAGDSGCMAARAQTEMGYREGSRKRGSGVLGSLRKP